MIVSGSALEYYRHFAVWHCQDWNAVMLSYCPKSAMPHATYFRPHALGLMPRGLSSGLWKA